MHLGSLCVLIYYHIFGLMIRLSGYCSLVLLILLYFSYYSHFLRFGLRFRNTHYNSKQVRTFQVHWAMQLNLLYAIYLVKYNIIYTAVLNRGWLLCCFFFHFFLICFMEIIGMVGVKTKHSNKNLPFSVRTSSTSIHISFTAKRTIYYICLDLPKKERKKNGMPNCIE